MQDQKMNKREVGSSKEKKAASYLESAGYKIITTNYFCKAGEIDIVAEEDGYLCFIEVKYRADGSAGFPEEAVDVRKAARITKSAMFYMNENGIPQDTTCRFDVVAILGNETTLIKNAFDAVI